MNRRKFLKVIGAGAFAVVPLKTAIEALKASPSTASSVNLGYGNTLTVEEMATEAASPGDVPAPSRGLGSNFNYYLASDCSPVTGLSVTVEITKDIISDIGFSIQLNANSSPDANHVSQQQYFISCETSNGSPLKVYAWVDNWATSTFKQSLGIPGNLINSKRLILTLPSATQPAGYKYTISLEYDKDQNINGAKFLVVDSEGKPTSAEILLETLDVADSSPTQRVTSAELAPINAFQLNLVGPINGKNTYLSAGAGTITYTATSPLTVLSQQPECSAAQGIFTAESANTVYGTLPAGPSQTITQSFAIETPHTYAPGAPFAVSQQFGVDQTSFFAIDGVGQLAEFYAPKNGHWQSSKPKGPLGMALPGAAVAVSQQFGATNQTDVFVFDQNGQLNVFWAEGTADWNGPQLIGPKGIAHSRANLAASQHFGATNQTDVFVVDTKGQLNLFWVIGSGKWNGPQPIGAQGFANSMAALAVSQHFGVPDQTDVFVVDTNGQLNVFTAVASGHWSGPQPIGPAGLARSGAALAVSQQFGASNQTDVFMVDTKGQLNVFTANASGHWSGPQAIGPTGLARSGAALAAGQHLGVANQTDVFLIDKNGQLNVFSITGGGQWSDPVTIGPAGFAPSGAVVVASPQFGVANRTDVFCINETAVNGPGWPNVFWAEGSGAWNGPKALVNES